MDTELDEGTAVEETPELPLDETPADTPTSEPAPTPEPTETPAPTEESFLKDPDLLAKIRANKDLNHFFGKMQGAYTKDRQERKAAYEAAQTVQRFYSDPAYADQVMQARAAQLGYQLVKPGQGNGPPSAANGQANTVPSELVNDLKTAFGPELGWMAEKMAPAIYGYTQRMLQPLQQQTQQTARQTLEAEFEKAESEMDAKYPGWDAKEQDLSALLGWLQNGKPMHPTYGNRYEALLKLHDVLNGNAIGTQAALQQMRTAARNKIGTGASGPTPEVDFTKQIREEPNRRKSWDLIVKQAEATLARKGVRV